MWHAKRSRHAIPYGVCEYTEVVGSIPHVWTFCSPHLNTPTRTDYQTHDKAICQQPATSAAASNSMSISSALEHFN